MLAGVALLGGVGLLLAREEGFIEARISLGWLAGIWRLIWKIPTDIVTLCLEAVRQLVQRRPARGQFRAAPSKPCAPLRRTPGGVR